MRTTTGGARRVCALLAVAVLLALTSCTGGGGPPAGDIVILSGRDDSRAQERSALLQRWNDTHQTKARIVELSGSTDEQHNEMVKEAQAPDSQVDVFNLDVTWTPEFAAAGYVTRLDPDAGAGFLPGPLATATYRGSLYALPFNTDAGLLYVNTTMVGCPASWADIGAAVARTRAGPGSEPAAVWAGQLQEYDGLVVNVLETLHALHAGQQDLFAAGLPALQEAVDTLRPSDDHRVLPASLGFDEQKSVGALLRREVAMLRGWPVADKTLRPADPEKPGTTPPFAACQLPGPGAVLGGQNLAVSSRSPQVTEAEELVGLLTDCASEKELFDVGLLAPTRACAYDTSVRAADPFTLTIRRAVEHATPPPQGPCYTRFSALFSSTVHASLLTGERLQPGFLDDLRRALDCKPPD